VGVDWIPGLPRRPASPNRGEQGGPNTTFMDPAPFRKYTNDLFLELHMMVDNPVQYLKPFADAGFKRFLGHIEKMPDQAEFVAKARELGEAGLAIDGPTDLSNIKVPYSDLDCILVMSIKAGASGQEFNPEYLKKVEVLRSAQNDIRIPIEVDGGINEKTIIQAKNAGVTRFVSTSFIFNNQSPQEAYEMLK
jgi:ribulose-phosphate 3-epimerase